MSKTIKQIADELGVSKQTLQKRISREPLKSCLHPYISTEGGTKYICTQGESLIISAFHKSQPIDTGDTVHSTSIDDVHTLLDLVKAQQQTIQTLTESNRELTAALENTTAALTAAQALHAGTLQKQLTKKAGFFSRFTKKEKEG